jgi:hypothetical protein
LGALALGAIAFGAFAVGAIAIGRLAIGRASIRRLNIDELVVRQLRITGDLKMPPKEAALEKQDRIGGHAGTDVGLMLNPSAAARRLRAATLR